MNRKNFFTVFLPLGNPQDMEERALIKRVSGLGWHIVALYLSGTGLVVFGALEEFHKSHNELKAGLSLLLICGALVLTTGWQLDALRELLIRCNGVVAEKESKGVFSNGILSPAVRFFMNGMVVVLYLAVLVRLILG